MTDITYILKKQTNLAEIFGLSHINSLGQFVNMFVPAVMVVFGLIMLFFIIFAGLKYMTSGGNKENTAAAQAMIRNAIIGLALFLLLFLGIRFLQEAFNIGRVII
jgi:hypothetical protein